MVAARKRIGLWEVLGATFIIAVGVPLHFLYSSTGLDVVAWLAPTNESTWEHFKLAFWPGLAWAGLEWWVMPGQRGVLWTAKFAALAAMPFLIATIFYGYTALLGKNLLAVDIATFVVAVAGGQWIGYRLWVSEASWRPAPWLIALFAAMFVAFSFRPPSLFLFEDPASKAHRSFSMAPRTNAYPWNPSATGIGQLTNCSKRLRIHSS